MNAKIQDRNLAYLYVIGGKRGLYKIGTTQNLKNRLYTIQIGNSEKLRVVFSIPVPRGMAKSCENYSHYILRQDRSRGEWFKTTKLNAETAVKDAVEAVMSGKFAPNNFMAKKTALLHIRIDAELKEALDEAATKDGVSITSLFDQLIMSHLRSVGLLGQALDAHAPP